MRVALIGGTGFVGGYLVDAILDAGHDLSLMVRPGSETKMQAGVWRKISGDISDKGAVEATVAGCDAVIYCIGILRESPARGITFESLQFDGVVRTVDAAGKAGARRFLLRLGHGAAKLARGALMGQGYGDVTRLNDWRAAYGAVKRACCW